MGLLKEMLLNSLGWRSESGELNRIESLGGLSRMELAIETSQSSVSC